MLIYKQKAILYNKIIKIFAYKLRFNIFAVSLIMNCNNLR